MAISGDSISLLFKAKGDTSEAQTAFAQLSKSLGLSTSAASSLAVGLPIAGAAIAAVAGVAFGAATAIFNLTKSTAEYGSSIFDASQKTGLGAETLSALRYAAETSGSSFEAITGTVAKFNVLLGEANTGSEKAQKTLEQYNITARDTESALNQAIQKIAEMKTADEQAAAAKALFKDRAGDVLAVIKSFDGDLPALIAKLEKLGLVMSDEDARAADEFGDTLDTLSMQAQAIGHQFAFELMPALTDAMNQISNSMSQSGDTARLWGQVMGEAVSGAVIVWNAASRAIGAALDLIGVRALSAYDKVSLLFGMLSPVFALLQQINKSFGSVDSTISTIDPTDSVFSFPKGGAKLKGSGGGRGGGGGGASKAKMAAERREQAETQAQLELQKMRLDALEDAYKDAMARIREEFKKTGDASAFIEAANKANRELADGLPPVLDALDQIERKLLKDPTETQLTVLAQKQQDRRKALEELAADDVKKNDDIIADADQKLAEKRLEIARQLTNDLMAVNNERQSAYIKSEEEAWDRIIADQKGNLKEQNKLRGEADAAMTRVLRNELQRQRDLLQDEKQLRAQKISDEVKDEEEKRKLLAELDELYKQKALLAEEEFQEALKEIQDKYSQVVNPDDEKGYSPFGDLIDSWKQFRDMVMADGPTLEETMQGIGGLFVNAFTSMTQAIGGLIQNWVLMGETGPAALKKILAATLASLAAEAGMRAIFELAMGFATLFFNPGEAAAHFTAAALFGSIAVGAALAGRALAGNSFKKESSGAYGSAGSGTPSGQGEKGKGGVVYSGQKDKIIETGRNQPGIMPEFVVTFKDRSNWFADMFKIEVRRNGELREAILDAIS